MAINAMRWPVTSKVFDGQGFSGQPLCALAREVARGGQGLLASLFVPSPGLLHLA